MSTFVVILLAAVSLTCALLLFRGYQRVKSQLLFWGALCFVGFALNSLLVIGDKVIFHDIDMQIYRQVLVLISTLMLLYGLIYKIK